MFIGHYALGLAAKRLAPRTSLGTLFVAPTLADLLWPVFLLLGWERVSPSGVTNPFLTLTFDAYPISHSLLALIGWGALYALLYRARTGYGRGAIVVGLLVVSHWVLDFVTHVPDMPLYPGGTEGRPRAVALQSPTAHARARDRRHGVRVAVCGGGVVGGWASRDGHGTREPRGALPV